MSYSFNSRHIISGVFLIIGGCIDPYVINVTETNNNMLVVDGYLNSSTQVALVKLSRAISLSDNQNYPSEPEAIVSIESSGGAVYSLTETSNGQYEASGLNLNAISEKYSLHIKTTDGKEYQSTYISLKQSPSLDSITWKPSKEGITLYINAHDVEAKTRYYQWTYEETWEYNADFYSSYKIDNGVVFPRPSSETFFTCWNTANSSKIIVGSTVRLSEDIVRDFPITFIECGSKKISKKYHITVQQRALSEEVYTYWQQLQKTTENLGGLFDPLPSQVVGNVHNIKDVYEPVLGYFNGGSVQEKSIFIGFYDLPDYLLYAPIRCSQDSVPVANISAFGSNTAITSSYGSPTRGFFVTSLECIDCRHAGGTTTKPDFWP